MANPYHVAGTQIPRMFDRKRLFADLKVLLTKKEPEHLSVIGVKLSGKSVLLRAIAKEFEAANAFFAASIYWDLRRETPASDEQFRLQFAKQLRTALVPVEPEAAHYLDDMDDPDTLGDFLQLVLQDLEAKGKRVLLVADGFDYLGLGTNITANMLDQMRAFAQLRSLRIVTGSRARLRDLCKTQQSRTSDFWRIFHDPPFDLRPLGANDWADFLEPFNERKIVFDKSAATEMANWTGGIPIFASAVAEKLYDGVVDGQTITKAEIDATAEWCLTNRGNLLEELWEDCTEELRGDVARLATNGQVPTAEIPSLRRHELIRRGLAEESGATIRSRCRLIERIARERSSQVADLNRLFSSGAGFAENIPKVLELRLGQVAKLGEDLVEDIGRAIRDVRSNPRQSMNAARIILESVLDEIWDHEHPGRAQLPQAWKDAWANRNQTFPPELDPFPTERGEQCKLLRIIAGRDPRGPRVANKVSRRTSLLVDQLSGLGNYSNHLQQEACTAGLAALMCYSAIELCMSLMQDLGM